MATTPSKRAAKSSDSVPQVPMSTPSQFGMPGHDFTLQAVMELQKSLGQMEAKLDAVVRSVDSMKTKVDDLVGLKQKMIGGTVVLGVVCSVLGFALSKGWDYITIQKPPQPLPVQAAQPQPAPAQPTTPAAPPPAKPAAPARAASKP